MENYDEDTNSSGNDFHPQSDQSVTSSDEESDNDEQDQDSSSDETTTTTSTLSTLSMQDIDSLRYILLIELWKSNERVVEHAIQDLVEILDVPKHFKQKLSAFLDLGGPFTMYGILQKYPYNLNIQVHGMKVFALASNQESFLNGSESLWSPGCGLDVILFAMMNYAAYEEIQRSGCCIVSRVVCCIEQPILVQSHCIQMVTEAMKRFPSSNNLQMWACWALFTLSKNPDNRKSIVECGGYGLLAYAIGTFDHPRLRHIARRTMQRLTVPYENEVKALGRLVVHTKIQEEKKCDQDSE
jgi:hypothetical protein